MGAAPQRNRNRKTEKKEKRKKEKERESQQSERATIFVAQVLVSPPLCFFSHRHTFTPATHPSPCLFVCLFLNNKQFISVCLSPLLSSPLPSTQHNKRRRKKNKTKNTTQTNTTKPDHHNTTRQTTHGHGSSTESAGMVWPLATPAHNDDSHVQHKRHCFASTSRWRPIPSLTNDPK